MDTTDDALRAMLERLATAPTHERPRLRRELREAIRERFQALETDKGDA